MVYLLQVVIFHSYVSHNQRVMINMGWWCWCHVIGGSWVKYEKIHILSGALNGKMPMFTCRNSSSSFLLQIDTNQNQQQIMFLWTIKDRPEHGYHMWIWKKWCFLFDWNIEEIGQTLVESMWILWWIVMTILGIFVLECCTFLAGTSMWEFNVFLL